MLNVLVAEDDLMIADMIEETLIAEGYEVSGIARTVADAVRLGQLHRPDLAIIDLKLADGGRGTDIIAQLPEGPRIGVLYASGNTNLFRSGDHGDASIVKPYDTADLVRALKLVERIVSDGATSPPFPDGVGLMRKSHGSAEAKPPPQALSVADLVAQTATLRSQQAAIAGFGSFALDQPDLLTILTRAAKVCAEGLNVPFCNVGRYRAVENDLLIEAGFGLHEGVVAHVVSKSDESSPQGRAFVTGSPTICNDLRTDTSFRLPPFYAAHGIVSTIDVIIKGDGKPYGVLEIDSDVQHDYDEHDINFLTGFANVLAEAVATSMGRSAQNTANEEKDSLLEQQTVLTEELQHRVRNNMQVVFGMLSRQMDKTKSDSGQRGIRSIARRVSTLAGVYDHLISSGITRTTDFGMYVKSFGSRIAGSQAPAVTLTCTCDEVLLDFDTVTALGIVLTELVINSYDHAFPGGAGGITVTLLAPGDGAGATASLTVSDDGTGFVPEYRSKRHGLGLVRRLIEQLRGTLEVDAVNGTVCTVRFPVVTPPAHTV